MITWGNFDLSRSMLPVATGSATAAGGLQLAASKLQAQVDQLEQLPSTPEIAAQIAALNGYIGQANAGAGYFAANHAGEALVSARLEGSADVAVGVNAGIMWDINSEWSLGMSWRSRMNMKVGSGHAALSYVSPETQQYLTLLNALSTMAGGSEVIPGLDRGTFSAEPAAADDRDVGRRLPPRTQVGVRRRSAMGRLVGLRGAQRGVQREGAWASTRSIR